MIIRDFVMSLFNNSFKGSTTVHQENHRRVVDYLKSKFRLCQEDAEDAVHNTILILLEKKHDESLEKLENMVGYAYSVLKNECFKIIRNGRKTTFAAEEDIEVYMAPNQIDEIDKVEKINLLNSCLSHMTEFNKCFLLYMIHNPEKSVTEVATVFGIKKHSVYTRRHRLQKVISTCVLKKINFYEQRK